MTDVAIAHRFISGIPDSVAPADNQRVKPSAWNDTHVLLLPENTVVGRQSPGTGNAEVLQAGDIRSLVGLDNVDNTSDNQKNAASVTLTNKTIALEDNSLTFTPSGTGGAARSLRTRQVEICYPEDYGAAGNGTTDDTTAFTNAFASAASGVLRLSKLKSYLIDDNLTVPPGWSVTYEGIPGGFYNANSLNLTTNTPRIILNTSKTISISSGCGLRGFTILRKGYAGQEASAAAYAGTAITLLNGHNDGTIENLLIVGFNTLISAPGVDGANPGYSRMFIRGLRGDGVNGIVGSNIYDMWYLTDCHIWPFGTTGYSGSKVTDATDPAAYAYRSGDAYKFDNLGHLGMVDCFAFGYQNHFHLINTSNFKLSGCDADGYWDNTNVVPNSTGFFIDSSCGQGVIEGCSSVNVTHGYYQNGGSGNLTKYTGCVARNVSTDGFANSTGDSTYIGCEAVGLRPNSRGFRTTSTSGKVHGIGCRATSCLTGIQLDVPALFEGSTFDSNTTDISHTTPTKDIASAATITLLSPYKVFNITGTNAIAAMNGAAAFVQSPVTLRFASAGCSITPGSNFVLSPRYGGAFTSAAAGDTITFISDGVKWYEVSRQGAGNVYIPAAGKVDFAGSGITVTEASDALNFAGASAGYSFDNLVSISKAGLAANIANTTDSASVQVAKFRGARATPTASDTIYASYALNNASSAEKEAFRQSVRLATVTAGAEDAQVFWGGIKGGVISDYLLMALNGTPTFAPVTAGALSLGNASLGWNGAFLNTGTTLKIGNVQVVATRDTGWTAWTGTGSKATKAVSSATTADCAAAIKSIMDALITHGLIGT